MSLCLRVVLRIKEAGGASSESAAAFYKHEGTRFTGTSGEHANATVKLVEGRTYDFSLALPSGLEIKELNEQGDREVQVLAGEDAEEAESVPLRTDDRSKAQRLCWTNTFGACANGGRQLLRLSMVKAQKMKLVVPISVKTYKESDRKGPKSGKPLMYANYKFEPNMSMGYDLKQATFC